MAYGKWIGGFLGFLNGGVLGAVAGSIIGALFDHITDNTQGKFSEESETTDSMEGNRNGFLFSLLLLSAHVIQADGKIMHSEMELARKWLKTNFGDDAKEEGESILLRLFEYRKKQGEETWQEQISGACLEIASAMSVEQRSQLIAFLCEIAKADGRIDAQEIAILKQLAQSLRLNSSLIDQLLAMGSNSLDDAYKLLGIPSTATDDEVKAAFRRLALQYHPDKVSSLGEDIKAAANKKFQEINEAKERIFKARNIR